MNEPSVQVPVSLLERIEYYMREPSIPVERLAVIEEVRALLRSQSAASAEPEHKNGCEMALPHGLIQEGICTCGAWDDPAPPSIADMAPGTTFVQAVMWTVAVSDRGEKYARRPAGRFGSQIITDHDIDPSTIRDVSSPEDAA